MIVFALSFGLYQKNPQGNRGFGLEVDARISLAKGKDGTIDLDVPLAASTWCPIGNKAAKAAVQQCQPRRTSP
jgi:hypothetical protein